VLQVPAVRPEEDLVVDLVEIAGIVAHPGYFFDFPREAYVIVSLLAPEAEFSAAAPELLRHLDCGVGRRAESEE
jgi:hypothetical protein